jgi:hypothetical protein
MDTDMEKNTDMDMDTDMDSEMDTEMDTDMNMNMNMDMDMDMDMDRTVFLAACQLLNLYIYRQLACSKSINTANWHSARNFKQKLVNLNNNVKIW